MKRVVVTFDIFVGNFDISLASDVVEKKVSKMFIKFGETKGFFVKEHTQGKYVVVKYLCEQDAEKAVAECNGALLDGVPVVCYRMDKTKKNKTGGSGAGVGPGMKEGLQKKPFPQKNPDIVPSVEPRLSSSPGPAEGESVLTQTSAIHWNPRSQMTVMITHYETPTLVWAQIVSDATIEDQVVMSTRLAEVCPTAPAVQGRADAAKIYGAQFSEDGMWYRCQVKANYSPERVKVQYIDFGNTEDVNPKDLVELPDELSTAKPHAIKIMLHNIRYVNSKEKEAIAYLKELTEGNYVTVTPTFRLPDGSGQFAHLAVGGVSLNQELIEKGFATQKQPKQQSQGPVGGGDSFVRSFARDGGGYGSIAGDAPFRHIAGEIGKGEMAFVSPGMQTAGRGGPALKPLVLSDPLASQPVYSDLKIELKNKSRALEKASKEKEIAGAELNNLRGKMKGLQQEFTALTNRLQENNISYQIQVAVSMVEKVRKLRSQFSDEESTPIDDAIQLALSEEKLSETSITTLPPLMTTLGLYRAQQQQICQFKDQPVPEKDIEARDATRKLLFQHLTDCIQEMEQKPFTSRAQSITQCIEKLHSHYDNFFSMPVQPFSDLPSVASKYHEFKTSRAQDFEQTRLHTDEQQQAVILQLQQLAKQLSLSEEVERDGGDSDLGRQLRQYCSCLQQEMASKNVEGSGDAAFIASLVKTVHQDLKAEVLCANNFMRLQSEFREMHSNLEGWLDRKPSVDKLLANRRTLKSLKSKLRHRMADKHDAEENEDEDLVEIKKDIAAIQQEIHSALQVEEDEMTELGLMIDSHFPELLALHPDCGLDIHLAYNGLVKPSHEVDHYDLKPVPGSSRRLFYSTFAGKPVIVMECLLSDGHHLGREDFLSQLTSYTSMSHPALLRPAAVFFDKNNRHAYLQIEKEGDILANYVEYKKLGKEEIGQMVRSLSEGLKVLHDNKVLHGEISPHTVIRYADGSVALLPPDFSCKPVDRAKNKYVSPNNLEFLAPEMLNMPAGMEPTGTVDMFCVGILILWLSSPIDPINYHPDGSLDVSQFQLDPLTTNVVKTLTSHMAQLRPSADVLLQTQFLQQCGHGSGRQSGASPVKTRPLPHPGLLSSRSPMPENMALLPNLQQPPPPLPSLHQLPPALHAQQFSVPVSAPPASANFSNIQQNAAINGCQSTQLLSPSGTEASGLSGRQNPSPPSSGYVSDTTSSPAVASTQGSAPSGFEEAALQQEQLEQESREAVEHFVDAESSFAGRGEDTGSFEIGTFSVEDVDGAAAGGGEGLRGRKITRQTSGEDRADAASEEVEGTNSADASIGDWTG